MRDAAKLAQDAICNEIVDVLREDEAVTLDQLQQMSAVFANAVWGPEGGDYVADTSSKQLAEQHIERLERSASTSDISYDYHETRHEGEDRQKPKVGYG